jgi:hypothetical protein
MDTCRKYSLDVEGLKERLGLAKRLYETIDDESSKIKLLELMGVLEEKIIQQEFKTRLLNGEE